MPEFDNNNHKERLPFEHYTAQIAGMDPAEIAVRCGLEWDGSRLTVPIMSDTLRISLPDFAFEGSEPPVATQILLLRYLIGGRREAWKGSFLAYRDMPWGEVYFHQFQGRRLIRSAWMFNGKMDKVPYLCEKLQGEPLSKCDAGFQFCFLPGLQIQLLLWDGDEEFPPSAQILFSDNFPAAFSAEDMAFVGDILLNRCKQLLKEAEG